MDIIYTSLNHRRPTEPNATAEEAEAAQVLDALWLHAAPSDGLEHATARPAPGRVDLLLYLLDSDTDARCAGHRAEDLLARSHHASPLLYHRYLPPGAPAKADGGAIGRPLNGPGPGCTCPRP